MAVPESSTQPPPAVTDRGTTRGAAATSRHRAALVLCLLALAAAPLLEVRPAGQVGVRGVPGLVLPPSCVSREVLGIPCPGCGLTRSFVHLAHGDWRASLRIHHLGWLLMAVAAFQIPYRAHLLWGSGRFVLPARTAGVVSGILIGLLFANWLLGFVWK